jgi:hypothetical protein
MPVTLWRIEPAAKIDLMSPIRIALRGSASTELDREVNPDRARVLLQWEAVPGAKEYLVRIYDEKDSILEKKTVDKTQFIFELSSLEHSHCSYQITSVAENGQTAESSRTRVDLIFSAPSLTNPPDGFLSQSKVIILTWSLTSLTESYQLQVSRDPEFQKIALDQNTQHNFQHFQSELSGVYYWRTKSLAAGVQSSWSATRVFEIK